MDILEKTQKALAELFPDTPSLLTTEGEGAQVAPPRNVGVMVTNPAQYGSHLDVLCSPDQVVTVAQIMDREGYFLEAIAGVDWLEKQQLEVVYDYNRLGGEHCRVMVRTFVPRNQPVVPTITGVFSSADWHERETFDFYGVHFQDHPNLIRILLPEDADFHPLRKDFMP